MTLKHMFSVIRLIKIFGKHLFTSIVCFFYVEQKSIEKQIKKFMETDFFFLYWNLQILWFTHSQDDDYRIFFLSIVQKTNLYWARDKKRGIGGWRMEERRRPQASTRVGANREEKLAFCWDLKGF